jgi:hypothetical protein
MSLQQLYSKLQNAENKRKGNIPCFSEKKSPNFEKWFFFWEFFWPHLDYAFSVVRIFKTSF